MYTFQRRGRREREGGDRKPRTEILSHQHRPSEERPEDLFPVIPTSSSDVHTGCSKVQHELDAARPCSMR
jgi:hypothetical protein